ncbi:hypothetical protein EDB85DRAFT_2149580 [Lactarius pseudohatsudake]|nr:hypothetical protein EDB85DRAFT_2149580 [Lactarius pseudohatsudake]
MAATCPLTQEHAEMLATKWWLGEEFGRRGVLCCEGLFMQAETDSIDNAIHQYQETQGMSQDDIDDLILSETRQEGFWAHVMHSVPLRCVRSVYDHVRQVSHPFRKPGKWAKLEDTRLSEFVEQHLEWKKIGDLLEQPADECRCQYHKYLKHSDTRHEGKWSPNEESSLSTIIQDMKESGQRPDMNPKFWKEVSRRMDNTWSAKQCSNKWNDSLSPTVKSLGRAPRWCKADSRILVHNHPFRIALLNVHVEDEIQWGNLTDEKWTKWSTEKLRQRWVALKNEVHMPNATHRDIVQRLTANFLTPQVSTSS